MLPTKPGPDPVLTSREEKRKKERAEEKKYAI
jgi:hypothetical protein